MIFKEILKLFGVLVARIERFENFVGFDGKKLF